MTEEQYKAIQSLERAFKKCSKAGLQFCGRDCSLYYVTEKAVKDFEKSGEEEYYGGVADVYMFTSDKNRGTVNDHDTYCDSGGW